MVGQVSERIIAAMAIAFVPRITEVAPQDDHAASALSGCNSFL